MSASPLLGAFTAMLRRDLLLAARSPVEILNPVVFFVVIASLFPLGIGPDLHLLAAIGPGILWVAALLSTLLALETLFRSDFDDGSLEQLVLSPHPLEALVLARVAALWLVSGTPLLVAAPLLAVWLAVPGPAIPVLLASLALGTPVLSLVGAIGVGLTVGLRRGGALMSLLVLPLYIPVLIFGAQAVSSSASGLSSAGPLYMLGALLALAATLSPFATAAALRISVE